MDARTLKEEEDDYWDPTAKTIKQENNENISQGIQIMDMVPVQDAMNKQQRFLF